MYAEVAALVRHNALDLNLVDAKLGNAGGPTQLTILYQYGDAQQVAEAYTPTAEARAVLAREAMLAATLPPEQRALLEAARAAWAGRGAGSALDAAQQMIASLPAEARATVDAARRVYMAQRVSVQPPKGAPAGVPLEIVRATVGPTPDERSGQLAALFIAFFIASFSIGPGVCVWLALSELMPTRIRSVGMGVALLINQGTGTLIAGAFLPIVGNFGYHMMFLFWAACTAIYFVTATFFLPETRGKSLEEIERLFAAPKARRGAAGQHG